MGTPEIGKTWSEMARFAEPAMALAYAQCTSDTSPAYFGRDPIVPPMFHVRLIHGMMFRIATDPGLGLSLLRLMHGEHDATFHRPIRPWDLVHVRARLESVVEKPSGVVVTSRIFCFVEGQLAVEARTVYFVRSEQRPDGVRPAPAPEPERPPPAFEVAFTVAPDLSLRYAVASLDANPIHTDPDIARSAGHPDVILQGLCTMAMTGAAAVRVVGNNDARRVRRLAVRFVKPVQNGTTLTVAGWGIAPGVYGLETRDAAGALVLAQATLELADR